jgi:hypothetical protein
MQNVEPVEPTLASLGFTKPQQVVGRVTIADLFRPGHRCGIYVLHYSNGEYYVGQAIDVTRRFVQHLQTHGDIERISFRQVPRLRLNDEEKALIWRLETDNVPLRNIALTSVTYGPADFDSVMSLNEQERWLSDGIQIDMSGPRVVDEELRRRYRRKYESFLQLPFADSAIQVLRSYVAVGIPAIRRGEVSFWSSSCLPSYSNRAVTIYSRINVYWQEVFNVHVFQEDLWVTMYVAKSTLEEKYGKSLSGLLRKYPSLEKLDTKYEPGGPDQLGLVVPNVEIACSFSKIEWLHMPSGYLTYDSCGKGHAFTAVTTALTSQIDSSVNQ